MFGRLLPAPVFRANCSLALFKHCSGSRIWIPQKTLTLSTSLSGRQVISDNLASVSRSKLSRLRPSSFHLESRRYLFKDVDENKEFCSPKKEAFLRGRDGMPKSYALIYRSDFGSYVLLAQIVLFLGIGAVIVAVISKLYMQTLPDEVKAEMRRKLIETNEEYKKAQREDKMMKAIEDMRNADGPSPFKTKPHPDDIFIDNDLGTEEMALVILSAAVFALSLYKLQRMIPVRIYMNARNHCVAIKYGHIIPGRITHHEFLAGAVKPVEKWYNVHAGSCYQDGSGQYLVFLPRFFRQPADYNKVLGYDQEFADELVKRKVRETEP